MTTYVLDASVAAKWFLPASDESMAEEARNVLKAYVRDDLRLFVPDLFWPELGNVLWKAVRSRRISRQHAEHAIDHLADILRSTFATAPLVKDAFAIASTFDQTVYDSTYLALSIANNVPFLTADRRLASALGAWFPIRWLGSL